MKFPANTTYVNLKHIYTSHNVHFSKITLHLCIHSEHIHIYIHTYIYPNPNIYIYEDFFAFLTTFSTQLFSEH